MYSLFFALINVFQRLVVRTWYRLRTRGWDVLTTTSSSSAVIHHNRLGSSSVTDVNGKDSSEPVRNYVSRTHNMIINLPHFKLYITAGYFCKNQELAVWYVNIINLLSCQEQQPEENFISKKHCHAMPWRQMCVKLLRAPEFFVRFKRY